MNEPVFEIAEQLARAETLPARAYTDPAVLPLEQERIFRRTWQFACPLDQLRLAGNYVALEILGTPVVLTRDEQGTLRAFYNVCRHRAGVVARGAGNRKSLQCAYHGWLYGLDGCLRNTPEFDGVEGFRKEDFGLIPIRVETWGPFAFINLDASAPPLAEFMGAIPAETARFDFSGMKRVERRDYEVRANWKVYIDNYLEGYHVPIAHPGLYRELDYERYRVDTFHYYSKQFAPIRPVRPEDSTSRVFRTMAGDDEAFYYWIFPNFMLNIYQGSLQLNHVIPLAFDRTLTVFEWYFAEPGTPESWNGLQDSIAFSDQVQREDIELCHDVWANLNTGVYDRGRFSVKRENGVHHFQRLYTEFLSAR